MEKGKLSNFFPKTWNELFNSIGLILRSQEVGTADNYKLLGPQCYSRTCLETLQGNLSWEITAMRPPVLRNHLSWETTYFCQKDLHFNITVPVTRDHPSWQTTFLWPLEVVFQDRFYCTPLAIKAWSLKTGGLCWQVHLHSYVGPSARNMLPFNAGGLSSGLLRQHFTVLAFQCIDPHWLYRKVLLTYLSINL